LTKNSKRKVSKVIAKDTSISKSANINCNILRIEKGVKIHSGVKLVGDKITIGANSVIKSGTQIQGKFIKIGNKSKIEKQSKIEVIEKFILGNRSTLCSCDIQAKNVKIGNDFFSNTPKGELLLVGEGSSFYPNSDLTIGDRCTIHNVIFNVAMPIKIGNDVGISSGTVFYTHYFWNSIFEGYPQKFAGISISDGCIIGINSIFLPGIMLGKECVVGAGSVVTKNFPDFCMIAGNPARIKKRRYRKKISTKKRVELVKSALDWYIKTLKLKGFSTYKRDENGLEFQIKNRKGVSTTILYTTNAKKVNKKTIVLSFEDLHLPDKCSALNLTKRTIRGLENELTDDLRDFLRKVGVRIFSERPFKSIRVLTSS